MKPILLLPLIALLFVACNKDDDNDNMEPEQILPPPTGYVMQRSDDCPVQWDWREITFETNSRGAVWHSRGPLYFPNPDSFSYTISNSLISFDFESYFTGQVDSNGFGVYIDTALEGSFSATQWSLNLSIIIPESSGVDSACSTISFQ